MRSRNLFLASLTAFVAVYIFYGLKRFTLGVDFTDEGAYVSWPLRMLFGEKPFVSELVTLTRPIEVFLFLPFKLYPTLTLYEFRLMGWSMHLVAFSALSVCAFRLSNAPLQSPLVASIPFFVCHIFGAAPPAYNTLSSDFFLIALSLLGIAAVDEGSPRTITLLHLSAGVALFIATFAHPALGIVAGIILARELFVNDLARNTLRCQFTPSNIGVIAFVVCWAVFFSYFVASGALGDWSHRIALTRSFTATALHSNPLRFFFELAVHPFTYSHLAVGTSLAALATICVLYVCSRAYRTTLALNNAAGVLAFLLIVSLIFGFSREPEVLTSAFALAGLILSATHVLAGVIPALSPVAPSLSFLLVLSVIGAGVYATTTYYFYPLRSWMSGILALPFAFAIGLALLLKTKPEQPAVLRVLIICSLFLAVACVGRDHYRSIWRETSPSELTASFRIPKLRHIRSTEERTRAIDALYDRLYPKLARGEPLLVFDNAPMLYYLFDAMPAYGLTWASPFGQSPATLKQLDRELRSRPLPRYAVRTLVNLAYPIWSIAPRANYGNYPLNETVMANYELEDEVFPFEIWRLKSGGE